MGNYRRKVQNGSGFINLSKANPALETGAGAHPIRKLDLSFDLLDVFGGEMGRHTAERRNLFSPVRSRVKEVASRLGVPENVQPKSIRRTWGFTLTAALSLVTAIDPYFGSISASAAQVEYVDYFEVAEEAQPVKVSLARGGYEVLSGADAVKVFVELAVIPSADSVQAIAYGKMAKFGWGIDQYSCLVKLWERRRWHSSGSASQ